MDHAAITFNFEQCACPFVSAVLRGAIETPSRAGQQFAVRMSAVGLAETEDGRQAVCREAKDRALAAGASVSGRAIKAAIAGLHQSRARVTAIKTVEEIKRLHWRRRDDNDAGI